jgi:hypothetical protein
MFKIFSTQTSLTKHARVIAAPAGWRAQIRTRGNSEPDPRPVPDPEAIGVLC